MLNFGITERGDAGLNQSWKKVVHQYDGVVLITKAPHLIDSIPDNVILHCTITGYGGSFLEPNVSNVDVTLKAYHKLVNFYGGERIILRIDPIISFGNNDLLNLTYAVAREAKGRVRISFLDLYPHVKERLSKFDIDLSKNPFHDSLSNRLKIWQYMGKPEICGEPNMETSGCISIRDLEALNIKHKYNPFVTFNKQRKTCECIVAKKELFSNRSPCYHNCVYCYWKD